MSLNVLLFTGSILCLLSILLKWTGNINVGLFLLVSGFFVYGMALEKYLNGKREIMARENLKAARKAAGMTQQEMAEKLDISLRYYKMIEAGDRTGDFEIWDTLEDIFGIHQRELRETTQMEAT